MASELLCSRIFVLVFILTLTACSKTEVAVGKRSIPAYFPAGTPEFEIDAGPTKDDALYPVFFGTTRRLGDAAVIGKNWPYSSQRDSKINYGRVWVSIPKNHHIGSVGTTQGALGGKDPELLIQKVDRYQTEEEFEAIARRMLGRPSGPENGYVVVYIHGYYNTFEDSVIRAAQFGADIGVPANHMFLFSWPSQGKVVAYTVDEATIDATEVYFKQFLVEIASRIAPDRKVHLVAHSMGNRALLRVISKGLEEVSEEGQIKFGQIILAAADVDRDLFAQLAPSYPQMSDRTTVYLSPYDFAVRQSDRIHDYPRVGCGTAPQVVVPGIDNVVSTLKEDLPAHAYFAENLPVLRDIKNMILRNEPARSTKIWEKKDGYWIVGGAPIPKRVRCWTDQAAAASVAK